MEKHLPFYLALVATGWILTTCGAVQKTMTVSRCQAILESGVQCENPAESGHTTCWRHHGAAKVVGNAYVATKRATTNAVESTRSGLGRAWDATKEAFIDAGEQFTKTSRKFFQKDPKASSTKK